MLSRAFHVGGRMADLAREMAGRPAYLAELPGWLITRGRSPMVARKPWWPAEAVRYVATELPVNGRVFEFGTGGSTLWLADLGARIVGVEHDREWYEQVSSHSPASARLVFAGPAPEGRVRSGSAAGAFDEYVRVIDSFDDAYFDLVILDGRVRVACGLAAMNKVADGGMLLLDDSDRARYRALSEALTGWRRVDLRGMKAGARVGLHQTTVWRKPARR
jgi:hypothetical protein